MFGSFRRVLRSVYGRGLAVLAILVPLTGCFGIGISANPFRVGNFPAGDIVRTHAKPRPTASRWPE